MPYGETLLSRFYSSAVLSLLLATPAGAGDVPVAPTRQFEDRAGFVAADVAERIEARLRRERERTGRELVVAILPGLPEGAALEDFTVRTAQAWRVGRRGLDDGVILFVFAADRRLRLEVGYGLEAAIPDAVAKRILDELVTPRLRDGDREGALDAAIDAIIAAAQGEPLPAEQAPTSTPPTVVEIANDDFHRFTSIPLLIAAAIGLRRQKARAGGGQISGRTALYAVLAVVLCFCGIAYDATLTSRLTAGLAGAGLLALSGRGDWPRRVAGSKRVPSPAVAASIAGITALLGIGQLAAASGAGSPIPGWSLPALASFLALAAFSLLGVWRAKLWSERILYLGLGALVGLAYLEPNLSGGRFPTFILAIAWAPIWTGATVLLNGVFGLLGLHPRRWWFDDSGRSSGLAGGTWSSGGSSSSSSGSSSSYSGGGGSFGGGGASGSW